MNKLFVVIDTSKSMSKPAPFAAMQEFLEKLYGELIDYPVETYFDSLAVYQCGDGKIESKGNKKWMPQEEDCVGLAPIADVLESTILGQLKSSDNNVLVIISDGYWCGEHSKAFNFELVCWREKLATLVEINVLDYNVWNLSLPRNLRLVSTADDITDKILAAAKQPW